MFKFKAKFGNFNKCEFIKEGEGTHTRYSVFSKDENDFGPVMKLNIPGYTDGLPEKYKSENIIVIRDEELDFLEKLDVVKGTLGYLKLQDIGSFYHDVPVVEIDSEKLMKLNECKEISFTDGILLNKDGKEPKKTPVISISEWDKYIVTLNNQEGHKVVKDVEPYIVKVQNVARTELECRPVVGKSDIFHITEKSPVFGGVIQDFYAKIDKELLSAMGVKADKGKSGSLKLKMKKNAVQNDNERED